MCLCDGERRGEGMCLQCMCDGERGGVAVRDEERRGVGLQCMCDRGKKGEGFAVHV